MIRFTLVALALLIAVVLVSYAFAHQMHRPMHSDTDMAQEHSGACPYVKATDLKQNTEMHSYDGSGHMMNQEDLRDQEHPIAHMTGHQQYCSEDSQHVSSTGPDNENAKRTGDESL